MMTAPAVITKKKFFVTLLLLILICLGVGISSAFNTNPALPVVPPHDSLYAGSLVCRDCHKAIYDSFITTAHHFASSIGSDSTLPGSIAHNQNTFIYNPFIKVVVAKQGNTMVQKAYLGDSLFEQQPIDIVVGSGRKGQTYLYWRNNLLFQLPLSYYTPTNTWCNSPGYPKNFPRFSRAIPARCLECHGSFARVVVQDSLTCFDKSSIVYGVNCERCHGPSAQHVTYQQQHPNDPTAHFIYTSNQLSRQQKLDLCALCHSGIRKAIQPAFTFKVGDTLINYSLPKYDEDSASSLDVHGNQYGLLTASKCFINSRTLTCSSCHNVHQTEIDEPAIFSARCMNCHNEASHNFCTMKPLKGLVLSANCIDCHMPLRPSRKIFLEMSDPDKSSPDFVRTHRIAIYADATRLYLKKLRREERKKK